MTISEKVAYLKGLADGMELDKEDSKESKLIGKIIDILEDVGLSVEDLESEVEDLGDALDVLSEDVEDLETLVYDDWEDDEDDDDVLPFPTELGFAAPVIEYWEGWGCDISGTRRWEDLPEAARRYVRRIEEAVGCPIAYVSVGAERDSIILR